MNNELNFSPDWQNVWTEEQINRELSPTKFAGEGWYFTEKDTLLVAHMGKRGVKPMAPSTVGKGEDLYMVSCWNRASIGVAPNNPGDVFNKITQAPVRLDTRGRAFPGQA